MNYSILFLLIALPMLTFSQDTTYNELRKQDWPNLKKYRNANKQLIENGQKPTAVFMGNSITEGWVNTHPDFFNDHNYVGRGIGGQTTPQMLIRFRADVIDLQPNAVVILAGTNDIAMNTGYASEEMIVNNMKSMAELAEANNIKVILSSILPVYDYPWRPGLQPVEKIASINQKLKEFAEENGHTYLDYYSAMANEEKGMKEELTTDGVHVTDAGYKLMEEMVLNTIDKIISK